MRYILICLIFFANSVFAQEDIKILNYETDMHKYVLNPDSNDSLCINDVKRAKEDISKGKIVFTQQVGYLFGHLRYEAELKLLCKEEGLNYEVDLISDLICEGQTQGCYGYYMDNIIIEKYGDDFKSKLHKKADSLFLVNVNNQDEAVRYWYCDERPRLPNESKRTDAYIPSVKITEPYIQEKEGRFGGWPFFDLGFIVEKDSTVTNFHIGNFVAKHNGNEKYKNELYDIVVKHIKENYPIWIPGKVSGIPVRTYNNVRIHIMKE